MSGYQLPELNIDGSAFANWQAPQNNVNGLQSFLPNWQNNTGNFVPTGATTPKSFLGVGYDTWGGVAKGFDVANGLFSAWGGLQQNKLLKRNMANQQNSFNANFSNQAQTLNNQLRDSLELRAKWNPAALNGKTVEELYQERRLGYTADEAKQRGLNNTQRTTSAQPTTTPANRPNEVPQNNERNRSTGGS